MRFPKLVAFVGIVIVSTLLLAACGSDPTATPVPTPTATAPPADEPTPTPDPFLAEWAELVAAAQEEGEVVTFICCGVGRSVSERIPEFEAEFGIKWTNSTGSSFQQSPKILAEREAGKYTLDVWMGGLNPALPQLIPAGALANLKDLLIHPEVIDPTGWYQGQMWWFDQPNQNTVLGWTGNASVADITYNTDLVDPSEITSYYDLLDPKWKGKIVIRDPRSAGTTLNTAYFYENPDLGPEWLERFFREADPVVTNNARQAAEWLATGQYSMCLWACSREVLALEREGQPVKSNWPVALIEGSRISVGGGAIYAMDTPAHPAAQKLFVNWWLSKAGQTFMQEVDGGATDSLREDVPKGDINPGARRSADVDYLFIGTAADYNEKLQEAIKFVDGVLTDVGK